MDLVSRLELMNLMPLSNWSKGMEKGFSCGVVGETEIRGRWIYKDRSRYDYYDEDTLEKKQKTLERRMCAPFMIDYQRSILRCESNPDAKRIIENLDKIPGVNVYHEDLNIQLDELHDAFMQKYQKSQLQQLGLKSVIHEKILMTDGNFKLLEPGMQERAVTAHKGRIKSLHFVVKEEWAVHKVKISAKGDLSYDDDAPGQTLEILEDMMMAFHKPPGMVEADNADQVQVPAPAKKKRKKGK